ncbi:MAG: autotransporter outer membrane beta-barrel domain-containing protein [Phyllobacterium sp.]|uniref:autotransporter outer membrane beta-barrel domain-containing protein n=1 Tax=Phyllobacterium sp. TaxID=1871046 RepID=UPI0030F0B79B
MRKIARHLSLIENALEPGVSGYPATRRYFRILACTTPLALAAGVAEAQQAPDGACLVEKVNKNGQSIGNPDCPQRGSLFRIGGNKDLQYFLVRSHRAPDGTFLLQSQNGQFDTGQFLLRDGHIRPFISNASGQEPHDLYNFDPNDGGGGGNGGSGGGTGGGGGSGGSGGGTGGGGGGNGGSGGGGGGGGGNGGSGGGTGGGGGGSGADMTIPVDRSIEQAITGSGALPIFVEPYTITERLVDWGFDGGAAQPTSGAGEKIYRGWFQGTALGFDDSLRGGDGHLERGILGFDMVQRPDLVLGVAGGYENASSDGFDGQSNVDFDGYFVGPFVAWKPDPHLVLDLWAGYAQDDVDNNTAGMQGSYDLDRIFVSANATGRWFVGETEIRPKLELFYSNDDTSSHSYSPTEGSGLPENLRLDVDGGHDNLFISTLSAEVRREYRLSSGISITPYARIGMDIMLDRPNDGKILDGDLNIVSTSSVTGNILAGADLVFTSGSRLEGRIAYSKIGQDDLDVYGGQIAFTIPF